MAENGLTLLQDLVGLAQFPDLALQFLDPIFLGARQSSALTGVAFGLLAPDEQTVRRTAKLRRNRLIGGRIAGIIGTFSRNIRTPRSRSSAG